MTRDTAPRRRTSRSPIAEKGRHPRVPVRDCHLPRRMMNLDQLDDPIGNGVVHESRRRFLQPQVERRTIGVNGEVVQQRPDVIDVARRGRLPESVDERFHRDALLRAQR